MGRYLSSNPVTIVDRDSGETSFVEHGSLSVVQHAHEDNGVAHFYVTGLTAATYNYILIDLSDTTNYPHDNTSEIHIDWLKYEIDSDVSGDYLISWGVLDSVDATDGDYYVFEHVSGSRTAGNSITDFYEYGGAGPEVTVSKLATGHSSLNDVAFQTDVDLPSTLSPAAADTPSGDGDLAQRITVNAGTIDVVVTIGYHTHSTEHP